MCELTQRHLYHVQIVCGPTYCNREFGVTPSKIDWSATVSPDHPNSAGYTMRSATPATEKRPRGFIDLTTALNTRFRQFCRRLLIRPAGNNRSARLQAIKLVLPLRNRETIGPSNAISPQPTQRRSTLRRLRRIGGAVTHHVEC